jgi:hypothetical protein
MPPQPNTRFCVLCVGSSGVYCKILAERMVSRAVAGVPVILPSMKSESLFCHPAPAVYRVPGGSGRFVVTARRRVGHALAAAAAMIGASADSVRGADLLWDAGLNPATSDRVWTTASNWAGDVIPGATDNAVFGNGAAAGSVNVVGPAASTGNRSVSGIRFTATADNYTLNGGTLITDRVQVLGSFGAASHTINSIITTSGTNLALGVANASFTIPLTLNGARRRLVSLATDLTAQFTTSASAMSASPNSSFTCARVSPVSRASAMIATT